MLERRHPAVAAALAVACALAAALIYGVAFHTGPGRGLDERIFNGFIGLDRPATNALWVRTQAIVDPAPFAVLAAGLIALALLRRRPRVAAAAALVLGGANLTTQLVKPHLTESRPGVGAPYEFLASWPSGHTTASMSLALCLVLVAPARLRPVAAAAGGLFVVAVVFSLMASHAHLPSDILGGFGVAAAWAWAGVAGLWAAERRWPTRRRAAEAPPVRLSAALVPPGLAALAACAVVGLAVLLRPDAAADYARAHTTFVAGAAAIGGLALVLVAALAVLLRRRA